MEETTEEILDELYTEEIQEHWLQFQQRLKDKGIWREDE